MTSQDAQPLLARVYNDALDPGYAALAARDGAPGGQAGSGGTGLGPRPRWGLRQSLVVALALLVVGALGAAVVAQTMRGAPDADRTRNDLIGRIETATAETDSLAAQVDELSAETLDARTQALTGSSSDQRLSERVADLERGVGVDAVTGPGVEVLLNDGPPDPDADGGPDLARVLDQDLQLTVNGLFAAGAEAVSINGQRITTLSAIRAAGDAVLVGYRPLSPPYVIAAIGAPVDMSARFEAGPAAEQLRTLAQTYQITFEVAVQEELTLPGKPDLVLRYARPRGTQ